MPGMLTRNVALYFRKNAHTFKDVSSHKLIGHVAYMIRCIHTLMHVNLHIETSMNIGLHYNTRVLPYIHTYMDCVHAHCTIQLANMHRPTHINIGLLG